MSDSQNNGISVMFLFQFFVSLELFFKKKYTQSNEFKLSLGVRINHSIVLIDIESLTHHFILFAMKLRSFCTNLREMSF